MDYLLKCILTLLYWMLHSSFDFLDYLIYVVKVTVRKMKLKLCKNNCLQASDLQKLSKLPSHIAFLVVEENISYVDLAKLVIWCIAAEIPIVSLFDMHGQLKRNQGTLLKEIKKNYHHFLVSQNRHFNVHWRPHNNSREGEDIVLVNSSGMMYPDTNGNGSSNLSKPNKQNSVKTVTISLLSPKDGKNDIIRATKVIANKVQSNEYQLDQLDENMIGNSLESNKDLPDPCLLVRLGRTASNVNFLPWQIRLTEIHSIYSHHDIQSSMLLEVLEKYGSCKQNFGK